MKILVVSDEESPYIWDYFNPSPFRGTDLILSCGDLDPRYLSFLATMIPAPLLYVHGNHDNRYQRIPPEGCTSVDGKLIRVKGLRILGFGGAMSARSGPHEFSDDQMRSRVRKCRWEIFKNQGFDILLTHAPALGLGDIPDNYHAGFPTFRILLEKYQPVFHFYGHVHKRYNRGQVPDLVFGRTRLINACGYRIIEF